MKTYAKTQKGFTLVELMIATGVFSVILLLIATGFIQIGRIFHKGVSGARTQEVARTVLESITRDIQFSTGNVICAPSGCSSAMPASGAICIGGNHYIYNLNTLSSPLGYVEKAANEPCDPTAVPTTQLLSSRMRLVDIYVDCNDTYRLCGVRVLVAQGEDDLLNITSSPRGAQCVPSRQGGQFCAVSDLKTSVVRRIL